MIRPLERLRLPLLALAAVLCASCAGPTPEPKPEREFQRSYDRAEVGPTAAAVDRVASEARREADALRNQVGLLRRSASEATSAANRADSELRRLIVQQSATEEELVNLGVLFADTQQRNLFLEKEAEELERSHEALKKTVVSLEDVVANLRVAATRKDEEVREMETLLDGANKVIRELEIKNSDLAARAAKAEVKKAGADGKGSVYSKLVWGFIVIVALIALAWVALSLYKPRLPF